MYNSFTFPFLFRSPSDVRVIYKDSRNIQFSVLGLLFLGCVHHSAFHFWRTADGSIWLCLFIQVHWSMFKNYKWRELGMVAYAYNHSIWDAEAVRLWVQGEPGLYSKILSQKWEQNKKTPKPHPRLIGIFGGYPKAMVKYIPFYKNPIRRRENLWSVQMATFPLLPGRSTKVCVLSLFLLLAFLFFLSSLKELGKSPWEKT
jgi:hypothetical protein